MGTQPTFGHAPATIALGDCTVSRLGFGAMRLPGKDVWGQPEDPEQARAVVRRAVEMGVNLIDTAWFYGPYVSNQIIAEALQPYAKDLVIATKLGAKRTPEKGWAMALKPEELRKGAEDDLRTLELEALPVVHLRVMPKSVTPFEESLGALIDMKREGKIRNIALSNVNIEQLKQARDEVPIVAVQNPYSAAGGGEVSPFSGVTDADAVLDYCSEHRIAYLPYFPLIVGALVRGKGPLDDLAQKHGASPAQLAIAWLLARSPAMLPIPGTGSVKHLEENVNARQIKLSQADVAAISQAAKASTSQAK